MWQRGETVVHQEVWKDRLWAARPLTVVSDSPELTLLWLPEGTIRKVPVTPPTRVDPADIHARTIASLDLGDEELGRHVRSIAEAVIGDIEHRRAPFSELWPTWKPDPTWSRPVLPSGWDVVHR